MLTGSSISNSVICFLYIFFLHMQLVGVILHEAAEAQQATVEMAQEAAELEAHWGAWLDAQVGRYLDSWQGVRLLGPQAQPREDDNNLMQ
jgi:hypothetical protein